MLPLALAGAAGAAGVATHIGYFHIHEHHHQGNLYLQLAFAFFCIAVTALVRVGENSWAEAISTVAAFEGSYLAGVYASLLVYRVFLSPLNKFPGTILARITNFYMATQIKDANAHKVLLDLHNKYGEFVRIGSSDLSITHPEAINTVYGPGSKCGKSFWYDLDGDLSSMHTTRNRQLHDKRRRVWSPAFSDKALRGYEDRIKSYGGKLTEQISAFSGKGIDVAKWFNLYSFDVMGDLAFGKSFDMLQSGEEHWAIKLLNEGMEPLALLLPAWFFKILTTIPGLSAGYWKFIDFCCQKLDERWDAKVDIPDIMSVLFEPFKGKKPVGKELNMLQADSRLIIVAGSDTTAATLTHVFYNLAKEPSNIQKLRDELTPLMEADGSVAHNNIQHVDHLNAVINETLRLHPPVPTHLHRMTPPEGIEIGGTFIPGNTDVICPQYVIGRSEAVYKNATAFYPERWYKEPDMIKNKTSFAPFSVGVYGCIGKPLALLELRTVIAKLVTTYDVTFAPGEDGSKLMDEQRDHFTVGLQPLNLCFTPKKG